MEFSSDQLRKALVQTGSLIRFDPGTVFGSTNAHFGVVVNSDPQTQKAVVVVCASSKVDKLRRFASLRGLPMATIVCISGGVHPHFGQDTAFNCNSPEVVPFDALETWQNQNSVELVTRNNLVDSTLLNEIRAGLMISDLVEDAIKDMLT